MAENKDRQLWGKNKIHSNRFQRNHPQFKPYSKTPAAAGKDSKWIQRLTGSQFSLVGKKNVVKSEAGVAEVFELPDVQGNPGTSKLLRPMSNEQELVEQYLEQGDTSGELRVVDMEKVMYMFNVCYKQHSSRGQCDNPEFATYEEQKWGLCWRWALKCENCQFRSKRFKLYREVKSSKSGVKAAEANKRMAVMLQETTMGISKGRLFLAGTGVPPPGRSALQKHVNEAATITATITQDSLQENVEKLKAAHTFRGHTGALELNVSADGRYDSVTFGNRQKMGQNANVCIGLATENMTNEHLIVAMDYENKLCQLGKMLRAKGESITCPDHPNCTATVSAAEPFTECTLGEKMGKDLAKQGVRVPYVTSDGDAHISQGFDMAMKEVIGAEYAVERQQDTVHLANSIYKATLKDDFSKNFFPGQTADKRKEMQGVFARDVARRCFLIGKQLVNRHSSNVDAMKKQVPKILAATLLCYQHKHRMCRSHSLVCRGLKKDNWWIKSFMRPYGLYKLSFTDADKYTLMSRILQRIGEEVLTLTRFNNNTNAVEGSWRSISASLPKNVNYARTGKGRASAAIHRLIHKVGNSVIKKCSAIGSPIPRRGFIARALFQIQHEVTYKKLYRRSKWAKQRKFQLRKEQIGAWAKVKDRKRSDYKKEQLIPKQLPHVINVVKVHPKQLVAKGAGKYELRLNIPSTSRSQPQ